MKTWRRVSEYTVCGGCGAIVATGTPMVIFDVPGVKTSRRRCQACAGEAPPDLPPVMERAAIHPTERSFTKVGALTKALPFDFKAAASGERDPGEEG